MNSDKGKDTKSIEKEETKGDRHKGETIMQLQKIIIQANDRIEKGNEEIKKIPKKKVELQETNKREIEEKSKRIQELKEKGEQLRKKEWKYVIKYK